MKESRRIWARVISGSLVLACLQAGCVSLAQPAQALPAVQTDLPPAAQQAAIPPSTQQLDQLVAPIALYPDELVAQILAAATYPTEIVEAHRWLQQNPGLEAQALAKAVDRQSWDPSVKALTQFPSVLAMMDTNLAWTSALGDAYVNGEQSVLEAVQVMRRRAQQAGTLKSTPQETIATEGQSIVIEPADPQVVYVPEYDPWLVYGAPLGLYPDWIGVPGLLLDGPGIAFDVGIGIGVFAGFGWGWHHWGTDWHRHDVMYDHGRYVSHSPTFRGHDRFGGGSFAHPAAFPHAGEFPHSGEFPHGGGLSHAAGFAPHGAGLGGAPSGIRSSAFSGFNHGGEVSAFSSRGRASFGASMHTGGFHGGGFNGGGFHGGGGHR